MVIVRIENAGSEMKWLFICFVCGSTKKQAISARMTSVLDEFLMDFQFH
jgi:hypothetical protein